MLNALVYRSVATPALTDTELDVVLLHSRTLNAIRGLTGALLKSGPVIVQYLEGAPDAVERTFAQIAASPLHRDVEVLERAQGVQPHFEVWHMGFCDFQRQHHRDVASREWHAVVDNARARAAGNPPLARLVECWDDFMSRAQAA